MSVSEYPETDELSRLIRRYGKTFSARATIYEQGDAANDCFLLQSGRVQLIVKNGDSTYSLRVLKAGELFGDEAWFEEAKRRNSAVALSDVSVLALHRSTLTDLMASNVEVAMTLVSQLVERLRYAEEQLENMLVQNASLRIVRGLVQMLHTAEKVSNGQALTLTPVELSSHLVLHVDEVKQVVGQLRDKGYLTLESDRIVIADAAPLRELAKLLEGNESIRLAHVPL